MQRDEIFNKVKEVLVEALAVDDDEVTSEATIFGDPGAESIDMLDIGFQLEQAFGFKIEQGEMFPEGVTTDPEMVQDGKVTQAGLDMLRERAPHIQLAVLEADPRLERVRDIFTVDALVTFVEQKLAAA